MATKESEDMESLCLQQNRRFHIRHLADDGISVLLFCTNSPAVILSIAPVALSQRPACDVSLPAAQQAGIRLQSDDFGVD